MPRRKILPGCSVLKRMYVDNQMSMLDIASAYGVSRVAVKKQMDKCGLKARSLTDARLLAIEKNKVLNLNKFNKHYFDTMDDNRAWALGVLYACASEEQGLGRLSVWVSIESMWVMRRLAELMDIEDYEWKANDWEAGYEIILTSVEMVRKLKEYGFPAKKKEGFGIPDLAPHYIETFLLGYYQRRGFTSYSKQFLEEIAYLLPKLKLVDRAEVVGKGEYRIITKGGKRWMNKSTTD